jgi:hypothetical protein
MEGKSEVYGMNEYLMIACEVEKACPVSRRPERHQKEERSPTGNPPSAIGGCTIPL